MQERPPFDLQKCITGDAVEWSRFVRFAAPLVLAVARRAARGALGDAEDDAQEVFVRLVREEFRLLRAFDPGRARIETYLAVITRTVVHERTRRRALPISYGRDASAIEDVAAVDTGVRNGAVGEAASLPFDELSEQQRSVLLLMHRQGLSVEEVARRLEIEPQTVRSAHHKAVVRLRELLGVSRQRPGNPSPSTASASRKRGDERLP